MTGNMQPLGTKNQPPPSPGHATEQNARIWNPRFVRRTSCTHPATTRYGRGSKMHEAATCERNADNRPKKKRSFLCARLPLFIYNKFTAYPMESARHSSGTASYLRMIDRRSPDSPRQPPSTLRRAGNSGSMDSPRPNSGAAFDDRFKEVQKCQTRLAGGFEIRRSRETLFSQLRASPKSPPKCKRFLRRGGALPSRIAFPDNPAAFSKL